MSPDKLQKAENDGIHKFFKLHASLGLTSMVIFKKHNSLFISFIDNTLTFSVHLTKIVY